MPNTDMADRPFFDALVDRSATASPDAPNILMIFSDEHHWRLSGYAGNPIVKTPNLDRLARRSVNFTNAYCNSPLCSPSRQSFMTGLYPHRIGMWNNCCGMPENSVTWAHALSGAGYETVLNGKMHFNGYQKMYGFDRRPVLEGNVDGDTFYSWGLRTSHDWTRPLPYHSHAVCREIDQAGPDTPERQLLFQHDARIAEGTLEVLREKAADRDGKPWALCCGMVLPHPPFLARPDLFALYEGKGDLPVNVYGEGLGEVDRYLREFNRMSGNDYTAADVRRLREAYYGLITELDEYVGRMLDTLAETGLADNTVVMYFSDHGDMAGEHGMVGKVTLRESSARVPLLIGWPGHYPEGTTVDTPVSLVDLFPTFLDIAQCPWPEILPLDGHSLLPLVRGEPEAFGGGAVFCEFEGEGWNHPRCFLREGRYKYVLNHTASDELYDLEADPDELHNLVGDAAQAARARQLRARILAFWDPAAIELEVLRTQARQKIAYCRNITQDLGW
jgi:choline-sulfatase